MAETGIIKVFLGHKNIGFIIADNADTSEDIFFHINDWALKGSIPKKGERVAFRRIQGRRGPAAKNVRPENMPEAAVKQPVEKTHPGGNASNEYRFLNPYNFVRPLTESRSHKEVLGNCPPPPHDRYVGVSGRIKCTLKAETPLFVSDSHDIRKTKDPDHLSYRFFRDGDGHFALPASSLRGMLRSVFETATNSCFPVFTDKHLSKHFESTKAAWLVPGRVEKTEEGDWKLRLLTGTSELRVGRGPGRDDVQYAAWLHRYWPMQPSKTLKNEPMNARTRHFQSRTRKGNEVDVGDFKHGKECFALLKKTIHPHPRIIFWDVIAVNEDRLSLEKKCQRDQIIVKGWLCLNNQNIEAKHSERFFFRKASRNSGPEYIDLPPKVRKAYEDLIADYQSRHAQAVQKRIEKRQGLEKPIQNSAGKSREAGLSRFVYTKEEQCLKGGELVYVFLDEGSPDEPKVKFIAPVSVPRVGYEKSIGQLLPDHLHHCGKFESLCPSCRLFGWVADKKEHEEDQDERHEREKRVAYAGRLRFSNGNLTQPEKEPDTLGDNSTLAILSSPKPTTTLFYLSKNGRPDRNVNYDTPGAQLRGRKFYRHHGKNLNPDEYSRKPQADQNRTAREVLEAGVTFSFEIEFENVSKIELGALLWALEFDTDAKMFHRLGYAKPLGFGSVSIEVSKLEQMLPKIRYSSLKQDSWNDVSAKKTELKESFKKEIERLYPDRQDFDSLPNIRDLKALLSEPTGELPVHYPRLKMQPGDDENFRWFVKNNKGAKHTLQLAEQDTVVGLPL